MTRTRNYWRRSDLLALLLSLGPMTVAELAEESDVGASHVRRMISMMKHDKEIHIHSWEQADSGQWQAIYAHGKGKHAKKPKLGTNEIRRRYRRRKVMKVASIFDLGQNIMRLYPYYGSVRLASAGDCATVTCPQEAV